MLRKVTLGAITAFAGHTGVIYYRNQVHFQKAERQLHAELNTSIPAEFRVGGTDDQIMDCMHSGDVIVMRKKLHLQYLPVALYAYLYRWLFQAECDHLAVIAVDKVGRVYLVENTAFSGVKIRPFKDRIAHSQSELIVFFPMEPTERKINIDPLIKKVSDGTLISKPEVWTFAAGLTSYLWSKALQRVGVTQQSSETYFCPNSLFAKETLAAMGFEMKLTSDSLPEVTTTTFAERQVFLRDAEKKVFTIAPEAVLIRTR